MTVIEKPSRIIMGAECTWWDTADKAKLGGPDNGLLLCPHCGGLTYDMINWDIFMAAIDTQALDKAPGYRSIVEWGRGQCFNDSHALERAYKAAHPQSVDIRFAPNESYQMTASAFSGWSGLKWEGPGLYH